MLGLVSAASVESHQMQSDSVRNNRIVFIN
jgi:hypothetical protein